MNKNVVLLMLLLFLITSANAQNYKFGKVTIDDLNSVDTSSVATVLYKKQSAFYDYRVDDGFVLVTEFDKRVKINSIEGLDYANIELSLYDKSAKKKEIIGGVKGVTFNLINGKIEKTKLKSKGVFEEKFNKNWKKIKIAMPNVQKGSVIDVKYYTESPFAHQIDDVVLQEEIPVREFEYSISIPEYYTFKLHENIKSNYKIKLDFDTQREVKNIKWKEKVNQRGGFVLKEFERTLDFNNRIIKFTEKNIPALLEESFSVTLNNYAIKLIFDLQSTKNFNDQDKKYATSWDLITKEIYESESFGGELGKTSYFKKDIDELTYSGLSKAEKISLALSFVKSKVKWNRVFGYFPDLGLKKSYKEGSGNVADINLMLVSVLRYMGVSVNPILTSTKLNGEAIYPTRQGFNYVICGVEVNNNVLLLDATDLNSSINILPERVLNWKGRLVREDGSSVWVDLFPKQNSLDIAMISLRLNDELEVVGKIRNKKTNYFAYNYKNRLGGVRNEDVIKELSRNVGEITITNFEVNNDNQLGKPIQQTYDFVSLDGIDKIGEELYLSPKLFLTKENNEFNNEFRKYPVDFMFPRTNKTIINIYIPDGYKVKSIPESVKLVMSDNLGAYSFLVKQKGNALQVSESLDVNFPIVPVSYYSELKLVYEKMIGKNAEKIVLEKI